MNTKGGSLLLSIVIGAMLFMAGMLFLNHVRPEVITAHGITGLDCTNSSISDGTKLTCLGIDIVIPGLILSIVLGSIGFIVSRFLL